MRKIAITIIALALALAAAAQQQPVPDSVYSPYSDRINQGFYERINTGRDSVSCCIDSIWSSITFEVPLDTLHFSRGSVDLGEYFQVYLDTAKVRSVSARLARYYNRNRRPLGTAGRRGIIYSCFYSGATFTETDGGDDTVAVAAELHIEIVFYKKRNKKK
jgi:hypothetical protein